MADAIDPKDFSALAMIVRAASERERAAWRLLKEVEEEWEAARAAEHQARDEFHRFVAHAAGFLDPRLTSIARGARADA